MGKFMDRFIPKPEHRVIPPPPVPEGNTIEGNGTYINEQGRQFMVKIFDTGKPIDLAVALGTLDIAKDVIKQKMSEWHLRDARAKAILIPKMNGNPNG